MERYRGKTGDDITLDPDGDIVLYADAQATIAALQARVQELEEWQQIVIGADSRQDLIYQISDQLTQRTAELEAIERILDIDSGKTTVEKVRDLHHSFKQVWDSYQDASNEMFKAQAELERVGVLSSHNERRLAVIDKKYKELHGLILALPKVEGAVVFSNGYVKDSTRCHALFGADEDAALYAALLQHRQGMEG